MECDSMQQQDHQNLQRDGILKQEISSPSNIMDIYSPPRNPNSPPSIDWGMICNGRMLSTNGRNPIPSSKVDCLPLLSSFLSHSLPFLSCKFLLPSPSWLFCFLQLDQFNHQRDTRYQTDIGGKLRIEGSSFPNLLNLKDLILWISNNGTNSLLLMWFKLRFVAIPFSSPFKYCRRYKF